MDNDEIFLEAFERLERAWRDQGAPISEVLAPGATAERLDEVEVALGYAVPGEIRAWWGWHDGAVHPSGDGWVGGGLTDIGPGGWSFLSSASAMKERLSRREITRGDDDGPDEEWEERWRPSWVPLLRLDANLLFFDCKQATPAGTVPIRIHDDVPEDVFTPAAASLLEATDIWARLLEERYVVWTPEGWDQPNFQNAPLELRTSRVS